MSEKPAKQKSPKKPAKKRQSAPPPPTPTMRTLQTARNGLREGLYTTAGCAAIIGLLMLLHMRPFG